MSGFGRMPASPLRAESSTHRLQGSSESKSRLNSLQTAWSRIQRQSKEWLARSAGRRLRVIETTSLGEKRFVSILQVDGEQFLLGGSSSHVVLLAKLDGSAEVRRIEQATEVSFADVVSRVSESPSAQPITPGRMCEEVHA